MYSKKKNTNHHIYIRPHEIISNLTTTSNIVTLYQFLRLSKSGSYVRLREVGRIVDRRIRSWIVISYIFSNFKQKYIDNDFICWVITWNMNSSIKKQRFASYNVIYMPYIVTSILTKQIYLSFDTMYLKSLVHV